MARPLARSVNVYVHVKKYAGYYVAIYIEHPRALATIPRSFIPRRKLLCWVRGRLFRCDGLQLS